MAGAVAIRGLRELQRDFRKLSKDLNKELRSELKDVGEPVREEAERLARDNISHIGERWSEMKIGVRPGLVYVAPRARRRRGSPRPNLAPLMMTKALEPALDEKRSEVYRLIEQMLDRSADRAGF